MKEKQRAVKLTSIIGICCLLCLIGCAARIPNTKYALLQQSTSSLLSTVEDTYTRIERLQQRFAVTTAPDSAIDRMRFKPKIGGQSYDLTPELQFREAAIEVLLNYMNVLQAFSSKDYLNIIETNQYPTGLGGLTLLTQFFGTGISTSSFVALSGTNTFFGSEDLAIWNDSSAILTISGFRP
jgi:hypothetical protein